MDDSIDSDLEYGSTIYRVTTPDGSTKYSYTNAVTDGKVNTVNLSWPSDRSTVDAFVHSHGAATPGYRDFEFSDFNQNGVRTGDIPYADYYNIDGYLVTPDRKILHYDNPNR